MKWKSKTERRSQELYSTAPTRFNDYLLHAKHCARIPDEHDRGDPSSQSYCIGGWGVRGQASKQSSGLREGRCRSCGRTMMEWVRDGSLQRWYPR